MPNIKTNILFLGLAVSIVAGQMIASTVLAQPAAATAQPAANAQDDDADSPLLREPEGPVALFDAAELMVRLARPELAARYLQQLMESDPSDDDVLAIREKHGPALFLKLARIESLQPYSQQLLDRMTEAFRKQATEPARLDGLIADLQAGGSKKQIALTTLRNLGDVVVPVLLQRLTTTTDLSLRDQLLQATIFVGEPAIPVLHGGLRAPGADLRQVSIEALGWLADRGSIPYLWFPAFGPHDNPGLRTSARTALLRILKVSNISEVSSASLSRELDRLTQTHLKNAYPWDLDPEGKVVLWYWNPATEMMAPESLSTEEASLVVGSHFASQALRMSPEAEDIQATYLALNLAAEYHQVGWDQPLPTGPGTTHDLALASGPAVVTQALTIALENSNTLAALATLQALSQIASQQQLQLIDSRQSPILAALNYPSTRVQFAAASAILQIDPDRSFPGKDRVVSVFSRAMNDTRARQVVVIDADGARGQAWAGDLQSAGFEGHAVRTGREGFELAASRTDIELVAIHMNCIQWPLSQTITNLRADARTSSLPIIVYGPAGMEVRVVGLLERTPRSLFLPETTVETVLAAKVQEFLGTLGTPELTPELRKMQIQTAAYWLSFIASGQRTAIYDLRPAETSLTAGIADPDIAQNCLIALSAVPTKSSQQTLLAAALQPQQTPELRQTGAYQLAYHIQRHGWLLGDREAKDIRDAHANEQSPDVATALAAVLGSLKPNAKLVGDRLQNHRAVR